MMVHEHSVIVGLPYNVIQTTAALCIMLLAVRGVPVTHLASKFSSKCHHANAGDLTFAGVPLC